MLKILEDAQAILRDLLLFCYLVMLIHLWLHLVLLAGVIMMFDW